MDERGTALLLVMIDIDPAYEDEFNRWYDQEHFPERMQCPGFLTGRRFVSLDGGPKYLAIYELADPSVLETEAYRRIQPPSEWTRTISPHCSATVRHVYRDITPVVAEGYEVRAVRTGAAS